MAEIEDGVSVDEQLKRVKLLRDKLELEDLEERVADRRQKKAYRKLNQQKQQESLAQYTKDQQARINRCNHKKGGKNLAGLEKGNSSDYALITHTFPQGKTVVMCQRCPMVWEAPQKGDPEYAKKLKAYEWALEAPTDNEPSGNRLFLIERHGPALEQVEAPAAAEKPKKAKTQKRKSA